MTKRMAAKILVIEDESEIREAIAEELTDSGYDSVQAVDGIDGLEKINTARPDLILCDITMPRQDGLQTLKRFKSELPDLAQTPFVFLTAYSDRERQIEARKAGADEFLQKPVDFELLLEVVKNQLRKSQMIAQRQDENMVKLFRKMQAETGSEQPPAAGPATPQQVAPEQLTKPKPESIDAPATVVGGHLAMVGIREIKDEFGGDGGKLASRIHQIAENKISQNLSHNDTYCAKGDDVFEICFTNVPEGKIASTITQIQNDIRDAVSIATQSGAYTDLQVGEKEILKATAVETKLYDIDISDTDRKSGVDLMSLVSGKIQQAANDLTRNANQMLTELVQVTDLQPCPVYSHLKKKTNMVYLNFDAGARKTERQITRALCNDAEIMFQLDVVRLGLCSSHIIQSTKEEKEYIIFPINIETIFNKTRSLKYFEICKDLPDLVRNSLILVVENAVGTIHPSLISDTIRSVKPLSKECFLRVHQPKILPSQLSGGLITTVVMSYFDLDTAIKRNNQEVRNFLNDLKKCKIKILIDSMKNQEQAEKVKMIKANYTCFNG